MWNSIESHDNSEAVPTPSISHPSDQITHEFSPMSDHCENIVHNNEDEDKESQTGIVEQMLEHLVAYSESKPHLPIHFEHRSRDQPELTRTEKFRSALQLYCHSHCLFLQKYYRYLRWPEDVQCFLSSGEEEEEENHGNTEKSEESALRHDLLEVMRHYHMQTPQQRIRNRRFKAMKTMLEELKESKSSDSEEDACSSGAQPYSVGDMIESTGNRFTAENLRHLDPVLWEEMVGQYQTHEEQRDNLARNYNSFGGLLMSQMLQQGDMAHYVQRMAEEKFVTTKLDGGKSDSEEEMDVDSEDEDERSQLIRAMGLRNSTTSQHLRNLPRDISVAEKAAKKAEFLSIMQSRFLSGQDDDFDYSAVDEDVALDEHEESDQDAEERYFDAELPNETNNMDEVGNNEGLTEEHVSIHDS